jgi:uncharacterized membrane protein YraQ (UPF0718 family)
MFQNKRLIVAATIAAIIAGLFWSQSRIPALNEKAQMGLRTNFNEIAFEIVLPVTEQQPLLERVLRSSVNWAYTNLQGMTFGILFAAAILAILSNIRRRQFESPWLNSVAGVFIGAPLGVCVNCATPIAFGIYSAGARLETALASLVASPTLNVIVLTMAFTLLPWEFALAKLVGVLVFIATMPLLVRRFAPAPDLRAAAEIASGGATRLPALEEAPIPPPDEGILAALIAVSKQFLGNLWYLVRFALPLMILAGVLGSFVIELVPFETFAARTAGLGAIAAGGLVAAFLPVPIAFDVIIVMALLANGVDSGLAMALLFGLGIYSIYPAAMIARYVSATLSMAMGVVVVLLAIALGLAMQSWIGQRTATESATIEAGLRQSSESLLGDVMNVCDELPETLQAACVVRHIPDLVKVTPVDAICSRRPASLTNADCDVAVDRYVTTRRAIDATDTSICLELAAGSSRSRCIYSVILRTAQRDHDVGRCDALPEPALINRCRNEYVNASLLFNPDDTACDGLRGTERQDCLVNAAIYRFADTLNITACDTEVPAAARDHCRYTIASTMIGRHDDASGCARIESPEQAARCESLPMAWRAARERSPLLCESVVESLRDTCLLRVADRRIETLLARPMLTRQQNPVDAGLAPAATAPSTFNPAPALEWRQVRDRQDAALFFTPFAAPTSANGRFARLDASALGISATWTFSITVFYEPFIIGKGIASGDIDGDDWPDLAFATERGVRVFRNVGGRFEPLTFDQGAMGDANLFLIAIVDIDGDGMQDLFASAYSGTNYILLNRDGRLRDTRLQSLDGRHRLTMAAGFGDIDLNGELDMVLGNWSSGLEKLFVPEQSGNVLMMQRDGAFTEIALDEVRGETNSVLVSDINGDHWPDVLIGNDRLVPDVYYLGDGQGSLRKLRPEDGLVPLTTMFTMSIDSADFDNDRRADIFSTDMTFARSSRDDYCAAVSQPGEQQRCRELLAAYGILQTAAPADCDALEGNADRQSCYIAFSIKAAKDLQDDRYCANLPNTENAVYSLCTYLSRPAASERVIDQSRHLEQTQRNTLLVGADGVFVERAEALGVSSSFWSWNAKAADLDNDGWQDIYVGNGFHFGENFYEIQENVLYRNENGSRFVEMQDAWGLGDPVNTPSYTYLDIDLDGDLDIVATGVLAAPRVYRNELETGSSLAVVLIDEGRNRSGIGATVSVRYGGEEARWQQREVKLSGGFLSFDHTTLYFGLSDYTTADLLEIRWPDGDVTRFEGPLEAGGTYRAVRRAQR